jgi:hypothetical protein
MTNLSPAAQAVLTAATQKLYCLDPEDVPMSASEHGSAIAAALRAVVAVTQQYQGNDCLSDEIWTCDADELLAIADELEAQ